MSPELGALTGLHGGFQAPAQEFVDVEVGGVCEPGQVQLLKE